MGLLDSLFGRKPNKATVHVRSIQGTPEELREFLAGETAASPRARTVKPADDRLLSEKTCGVRTLRPPAPCGFNFDRVLVTQDRVTDKETGEIKRDNIEVRLDGGNLFKAYCDQGDLNLLVDTLLDVPGLGWVPQGEWIRRMHRFSAPGDIDGYRLNGRIIVQTLTGSGAVKKFPLRVDMDIADSNGGSMISHLDYLQDGTIGKAQIIEWGDHGGIMCVVDIDKQDCYYIKDVKVCGHPKYRGPDAGGWVSLSTLSVKP